MGNKENVSREVARSKGVEMISARSGVVGGGRVRRKGGSKRELRCR